MRAQIEEAKRERGQGSRSGAVAGCLLLAAGLSLLGGCATGGKAKVAAVPSAPVAVAEPAPAPPAGASVDRLTGGREGFTIKEPSSLDGQTRSDFEQASVFIREGKYDKGIELLEKVIAVAPEITAPRINAAIAYRQANKPEQAEAHLKKALEIVPGHPLASNEYGLLLRKAGRFTESRQIFETALATFPEYHPLHRNLGILCDLYLRDASCAVRHYELYGKAVPKDSQVKLWLADLATRSAAHQTASTK